MEETREIKRSDVWSNISEVLARLDLKGTTKDSFDRQSAATEIEGIFIKLLSVRRTLLEKEMLFSAYKEGFNDATESIVAANKVVQERELEIKK